MTQPTLGPADPVAPVAQKFYTLLTAVGSLVGVASTFGMITGEQAASLGQVSTTGIAFVLALGTAVASFRTNKQLRNGTFDPAPPPSPALDAAASIKVVSDAYSELTTAVAAGADLVRGAVGIVPGLSAITGGADSLVQRVLDATRDRDAALAAVDRSQQPPAR